MQVKKQQLELDIEQHTGSKSGKEYVKAVYCHPAYLTYTMWNVRLDEAQAGIKIAGRSISNLRYADDTTLMAEGEEELKSLLMKMKEESEKVGLKLNIQKTEIMASGPIISWRIDGETIEIVTDYFFGSKITADGDCSHEIKRHLLLERKAMINLVTLVTQSRPTLWDPMDCSPLGSSVHAFLQARILEWFTISFSRGSSQVRDWKWFCSLTLYPLSHQGSPWST